MAERRKIDGRTKRAADIALAKRQIFPASYRALVEEGRITLQHAKELGRDRGPDDTDQGSGGREEARTGPRSATGNTSTGGADKAQKLCLCGCGEPVSRSFKPGHDARLRSELLAQIKKGDVLLRSERITPEQRAFAVRHGRISEDALPEEELGG